MNEYDICVIGGAGHVGLPISLLFAQKGKKVVAYDINNAAVEGISQGKFPFLEKNGQTLLNKVLNKTFFITTDKTKISQSRIVIISIGTPVDEHLNPQITAFRHFLDDIFDLLLENQHIILRSTVYPGTTQKTFEYFQARGKKLRVSFCPERIAEGNALEELCSLPQIISSVDEEGVKELDALFSLLSPRTIRLSPIEAELAKLFTNSWRYIQFSIANQFYELSTQFNLDFYRIFDAITCDYPRAKGFPKAGFAAGPCLLKDTMQLAAFSNNNFFLGHAAMLINEGMPNFIIGRLKDRYPVHEMVVGILGMTFKADNDDRRDSLGFKLKKILEIEARQVLCTDVYLKDTEFKSVGQVLSECRCVIIAAPHREYAALSFETVEIIVDVWNFLGKGGLF
jgi:UDP-N-acetyl-D-mannosaminuronic acid dehydrogenase